MEVDESILSHRYAYRKMINARAVSQNRLDLYFFFFHLNKINLLDARLLIRSDVESKKKILISRHAPAICMWVNDDEDDDAVER